MFLVQLELGVVTVAEVAVMVVAAVALVGTVVLAAVVEVDLLSTPVLFLSLVV